MLSLQHKYRYNSHIPSPAPTGGFFITCTSPKKTRTELTKVNKPVITHLLATTCKSTIFPMVKRPFSTVNKIAVFTTQNLFTHYYSPLHLWRGAGGEVFFLPSPRILKEKQ